MLAITNVTLPTLHSIIVASSSESLVMSTTSICLLLITMAVRIFPIWNQYCARTWYSYYFVSTNIWFFYADYVRFFFVHYF